MSDKKRISYPGQKIAVLCTLLIRQLTMPKLPTVFGAARPMYLRSWDTLKAVPMSLRHTGLATPCWYKKYGYLIAGLLTLILSISRTNAQDLIVVMDLVITSNISKTTMDSACNKISKEIARDKQYVAFDRQFLNITLEQAGAQGLPCSDTQCLADAGALLGAKYIVGGSLYLSKGVLDVTLNRVDVGSGKAVQSVQWQSQASINFFLNEKIPSLVKELMTDKMPDAKTAIYKKKSSHPLAWIGMSAVAVAGGGVAVFLLNKKGQTAEDGDLPIEDRPVHGQ